MTIPRDRRPTFETQKLVSRDGAKEVEVEQFCVTCRIQKLCDLGTGYCRDCWRIAVLAPWVERERKLYAGPNGTECPF